MILIADSGSTKTEWAIIGAENFFTDGINPFFQTDEEILEIIKTQLFPQIEAKEIQKVFFYGAGCAFPAKNEIVRKAIATILPQAIIEVESDLLGAVRSLLQKNEGVAGVLGTGSNSCLYDGERIVQNTSPLGFILGNEGGGDALGKRLVSDVLKKLLPENICAQFFARFDLTPEIIMENVYKKTLPNRFLASLSVFLYENKHLFEIEAIILQEFERFFDRNILQYRNPNKKIAFVGSVAYYFEAELRKVADKKTYTISKIMQSPMQGLLEYHV